MDGIKATIATHKGTQYCPEHNRRDEKVCSKEQHINLSRPHEIWIDEKIEDAYDRIFGNAINEYNEKQKRNDRKIKNYYAKIKGDKSRKTANELIIGVYYNGYNSELCKMILREFVNSWKERNPALEIIGAYYHDDEMSTKGPHVHIDYVPVGSGYKNGLKLQCSQEKALNNMGFISTGKRGEALASTKWIHRENSVLEKICNEYGITVIHPKTGDAHLNTSVYKKVQKQTERLKEETDKLLEEKVELSYKNKLLNDEIYSKKALISECSVKPIEPTLLKEKHKKIVIDKESYDCLQQRSQQFSAMNIALKNQENKTNEYAMGIYRLQRENEQLRTEKNQISEENKNLKDYKIAYEIVVRRLINIERTVINELRKAKNSVLSAIKVEIDSFRSEICNEEHIVQQEEIER